LTAIRQKLAAIFQGEHAEHLEHIRSILALLESVTETKGRAELDEAFRRAHSLKGAARAVDLDTVEGLASGLETLFSRVREGTMRLDPQMSRVVHQVLDASEECVAAFRDNRIPAEPGAALQAIEGLLGNNPPGDPAPIDSFAKTPAFKPSLPMAEPGSSGVSLAPSQPAEMDGSDSHRKSAASQPHRGTECLGRSYRRNGGRIRTLSQNLGCGAVALRESAGVRLGSPIPGIRRTKSPVFGGPVECGAPTSTAQRLEHPAFGGTTPARCVERAHGSR